MDEHFWLVGLSFVISVVLSAVFFALLVKKDALTNRLLTAALSIGGACLITTTLTAAFFWFPFDFVSPQSKVSFLAPLFFSTLILMSFFSNRRFSVSIGVLGAAVLSVLFSPLSLSVFPDFPVLNTLLTIVLLWGYAMGFRALSGLNSLVQTEGMLISGGLTLLFIFGQAPFIMGASSAALFGALAMAYFVSEEQPISPKTAPFIGFLTGWLGLLSFQEYIGPCFIIFSLFVLTEAVVCLLRKATFLKKYSDFAYNSFMLQALKDGLPAADLVKRLFYINATLLIIGMFQLAGTPPHSLIAFAAILTFWQIYRIAAWRQESKSFKEVNGEVFASLKIDFKKIFSKPSSRKTQKTDKSK